MYSPKPNDYKAIIHIHPVSNELDDSFIGIKIRNEHIHFYYPEMYHLSLKNPEKKYFKISDLQLNDFLSFRKDVLSILNTISLAKTVSKDKIKIESTISNNTSISLISYLWITQDYLTNGFYINREKIYKNNVNGKVNWKRTLNTSPIISNSNIIYNNVIVEKRSELDNLIVEIHKSRLP